MVKGNTPSTRSILWRFGDIHKGNNKVLTILLDINNTAVQTTVQTSYSVDGDSTDNVTIRPSGDIVIQSNSSSTTQTFGWVNFRVIYSIFAAS